MCGGVRFQVEAPVLEQLAQAYTPEQLAAARAEGSIVSVFWQPRPVLPVLIDGAVQIFDWGNRDREITLPQTGWARQESLEAGKWRHLRPEPIVIPARNGLEKKVWFDIQHGIRGYLVQRAGVERVYMLTTEASPSYRALTNHDRMPVLIDQLM